MDAVIKKVTPSAAEVSKLNSLVNNVLNKIRDALFGTGVAADAIVAGSFAKGTWLSGSHDIDFFIKFLREQDMNVLPSVIKSCFPNAVPIKGTRTYYSVSHKGCNLEFVPVLKLNSPEQATNSMDASPFHVDYVKARLNPKIITGIRLLKQFCKAQGVYGAESYVGGFSGYVVELLMLYFKSFNKLIDYLVKCRPKLFIDTEGYYPSAFKAFKALGSSKTYGPLVLIDPVLPVRNAAASVSGNSFAKLVLAARLFSKKPSASFFTVKQKTLDSVKALAKKRGHYLITHLFKPDFSRKDVFFSKLEKNVSKMADAFRLYGFDVYDSGFLMNGLVYFELGSLSVPVSYRAVGPLAWHDSPGFFKFIEKHKTNLNGPYIKNSRVCFDLKKKFVKAKDLFSYLLKIIK